MQAIYGQPQYGAAPAYSPAGYGTYDPEEAQHKAKKAQEAKERFERHERKRKAEMAQGASLVKWLCFAAISNAGLLLVPVFGNSWAHKQFVGMGVKMLTVRTSLFMIDIQVDCGKNFFEDKLCKFGEKMHGMHSLHQGQQIACSMTSHACAIMDKVYYGSFIVFFFFAVALICDLTAALFLYYYWYGTPLAKIRKSALIFFFAGPLSACFGLMFWTCYSPDLGELPLAWTHSASMITGTDLFSYKEVNSFSYGWSYIFAWFMVFLLSLQLLAWTCCFREHNSEDDAEAEEELAKLMIEDPALFETQPLAGQEAKSYAGVEQNMYATPPQPTSAW